MIYTWLNLFFIMVSHCVVDKYYILTKFGIPISLGTRKIKYFVILLQSFFESHVI